MEFLDEDGSERLGRRRFVAGTTSSLFLGNVWRQVAGWPSVPVDKISIDIRGTQNITMRDVYYLNGFSIDGGGLDGYRTRDSGWEKTGRYKDKIEINTSSGEVQLEGSDSLTFGLRRLDGRRTASIQDVFKGTKAESYSFSIYPNLEKFRGGLRVTWGSKRLDVPLFGLKVRGIEDRTMGFISRLSGEEHEVKLKHSLETDRWYDVDFKQIDYENGSGTLEINERDGKFVLSHPFSFDPSP